MRFSVQLLVVALLTFTFGVGCGHLGGRSSGSNFQGGGDNSTNFNDNNGATNQDLGRFLDGLEAEKGINSHSGGTGPGFQEFEPGTPGNESGEGSPSVMPTGAKVSTQPLCQNSDFLTPLIRNPKTAYASISWHSDNAAMENQVSQIVRTEGIQAARHGTQKDVLQNILQSPMGTDTMIIGSHGCPGFVAGYSNNNAHILARALRDRGIKRVIFTACSTGAGERGSQFLHTIAKLSGAEAFAITSTVWAYRNKMVVKDCWGHLKAAIPTYEQTVSTQPNTATPQSH